MLMRVSYVSGNKNPQNNFQSSLETCEMLPFVWFLYTFFLTLDGEI